MEEKRWDISSAENMSHKVAAVNEALHCELSGQS
jgi:hypothetical protein